MTVAPRECAFVTRCGGFTSSARHDPASVKMTDRWLPLVIEMLSTRFPTDMTSEAVI